MRSPRSTTFISGSLLPPTGVVPFAEVTPRGQCYQPGTPTALQAGGLLCLLSSAPHSRPAGQEAPEPAAGPADTQEPWAGAEAVQVSGLGSRVGEPVRWGRNKMEGPDAWGAIRDPRAGPRVLGETLVLPWACGPFSLLWRCLDPVCGQVP